MTGSVSTPLIIGLPLYSCGGTAGGAAAAKTFTVDDPNPANVTTIRLNTTGIYGFDQRGIFKTIYVGCGLALVSTRGEVNAYTLTSVFVGTGAQGMSFGVSVLQIGAVNFSGNYSFIILPGLPTLAQLLAAAGITPIADGTVTPVTSETTKSGITTALS